MAFKALFNRYYQFSKPGIVYANVLTAWAGFLFGSQLRGPWLTLLALITGMAALIVGACAMNNVIDRNRDANMSRTAQRGLVRGTISLPSGLAYGAFMSLLGALTLALTQNGLATLLALVAYVDYVIVYAIAKRHTVHGTLVGCVSGALPLVAGYVAAVGRIDATAGLLFGLMVAWQMAHFFGIALFRLKDYTAAGLPVMPVRRGVAHTKPQVIIYMLLFIAITLALTVRGDIGVFSGGTILIAATLWLYKALQTYRSPDVTVWGKQVFLHSLTVIMVMVAGLSVGSVLR